MTPRWSKKRNGKGISENEGREIKVRKGLRKEEKGEG
jgi:hypothetical protein